MVRTWLLGPQPESGYVAFVPWFIPGGGGEWYRVYSRGGDADTAGKKGFGVHVNLSGTGEITLKFNNGTVITNLGVTKTWVPGDLVEVAWRFVPTTLPEVQVYISVAVNWGAWTDAGPSIAFDLPDVWTIQKDALNETVENQTERACVDYIVLKIAGDYTLTADDLRQLLVDPAEGMSMG